MLFAAVVIPIVRYDDPALVFVKRAEHLRRNPGQIAFPGGIIDSADLDARAAALREFEEELGIARDRVRSLERLDDVVTLALAVTVTPYLGALEPPVRYALEPGETQSVHEVPLRALYAPGALRAGTESVIAGGVRYDVPSWLFDYAGLHVWGATARMLQALLARFRTQAELLDYLRAP